MSRFSNNQQISISIRQRAAQVLIYLLLFTLGNSVVGAPATATSVMTD